MREYRVKKNNNKKNVERGNERLEGRGDVEEEEDLRERERE